jgi:hypothetical protein
MFSLPPLPTPTAYRFWLPAVGAYVRAVDLSTGQVTYTADEAEACCMPDAEAREVGQALAEASRTTVDLRQAQAH